MERPTISMAVVMERQTRPNQWEDWRFRVAEVVPDTGFAPGARVLRDDGQLSLTLHPGFDLSLYRDECEGYLLNLTSGSPVWFVMWRISDEDPSQAWPETVSLSYNEAGRWLDAQERVDNVPMSADVAAWLQAYADENYRPEPKKRRRPASFLPPEERPE